MAESKLVELHDKFDDLCAVDVYSIEGIFSDIEVLYESTKLVWGTAIVLVSGRTLFVKESPAEVLESIRLALTDYPAA